MKMAILQDLFRFVGKTAGAPHPSGTLATKWQLQNLQPSAQRLVWVLIFLMILSYVAGTFLFWARLEGVWPFD